MPIVPDIACVVVLATESGLPGFEWHYRALM